MSACNCFKSIEQVTSALESAEETRRLIHWLEGGRDQPQGGETSGICDCIPKSQTSLIILNAIRDACRPFLEPNRSHTLHQSLSSHSPHAARSTVIAKSYADEFPLLGGTSTPRKDDHPNINDSLVGKRKAVQKKRVRPLTIQSTLSRNDATRKGNLVHVLSSDEPLLPSTRSTTTPRKGSTSRSETSSGNTMTPPPKSSLVKQPLTPTSTTLSVPTETGTPVSTKESAADLSGEPALTNLIEVYVAMIQNSLVPSTLRELCLIVSALNATAAPCLPASSSFSSILSSLAQCIYFGAQALSRLSLVVRGIGPSLMQQLVQNTSFQTQLPELTAEYKEHLQQRADKHLPQESVLSPQAALFTLPFDERMDSRHNFKTVAQQAAYKNREETRDRFLHNIRSFLSGRGKGFCDNQAKMAAERVKAEARTTIDLLMDSNICWFCDVFCQLLLQVGLVPLEESDKDILILASQEKLSKLHQRFSDSKGRGSTSRKVLRPEPTTGRKVAAMSTPDMEAQQLFPGHQEFFYMFIRYADSYRLGRPLLATLVVRLNELRRRLLDGPSEYNIKRSGDELKILAKFIGMLTFSPNWGLGSSIDSLNGLLELDRLGLTPEKVLRQAMTDGSLVITVLWLAECLYMAKWDDKSSSSSRFYQTLAQLQRLQRHAWRLNADAPGNSLCVILSVEHLLSGLHVTTNFPLSETGTDVSFQHDTGEACLDQIEHTGIYPDSKDVEELLGLVIRLDQTNCSPLKSPGASRKVRPSMIRTPINSNNGANLGDSAAASADLIQKKLVQSFFHKHQDMKHVYEILQKQVVSDAIRHIIPDCVEPFLKAHELRPDTLSTVAGELRAACREFVSARIVDRARKAFHALFPAKDEQTIKIAVSLLVRRGLESVEAQVNSVIAAEIERKQTSSKQLFPTPLHSSGASSDSKWRLATCSLERLVDELPNLTHEQVGINDTFRVAIRAVHDLSSSKQQCVPADEVLRCFFDAILLLDARFSKKVVNWSLTSSDNDIRDRWKVLSLLLELAVALTICSRRGLCSLTELLRSQDELARAITLGLAADEDIERMVGLLSALVEKRLVKVSIAEVALLSVATGGHPRSRELIDLLAKSDVQWWSQGIVKKLVDA